MAVKFKFTDIPSRRLRNQQIDRSAFESPDDVVRWFGAMQAQDYLEALWAVGLRTRAAVQADIEQAIAQRAILRTWPMRGTLHFVAPNDARWMLELLTPRVLARAAARYRELELTEAVFARAANVCVRSLESGRVLTRTALYEALGSARISTAASRGLHIVSRLSQQGLLCFGPRSGKQPTFVLLEEWVPNAKRLTREEGLARLALRYFTSHGPAQLPDFTWWSGLTVGDARAGLAAVKSRLVSETIDGRTYWFADAPRLTRHAVSAPRAYLLPVFDEYAVAYRDRSAVLDPALTKRVNAGGGIFKPILVVGGSVVGTWKRVFTKGTVAISLTPFARLTKAQWRVVEAAADHYGRFRGMPAVVHPS
ncbi:MAG: winged helix DNA-binding domain-containing protein [Gemmatimonadaceae bacterium]